MALKVRAEFDPAQFTATRWSSAQDKAVGLEKVARFVESGFAQAKFTKAVYDVLYQHLFSHIAHYDRFGFYDEWFSSPDRIRGWFRHAANARCVGDPTSTWSDAEKVIQAWLAQRHATG